ncbi:MAG: pseudouridine synthase [Lachnospiraceae bacterium]|nr:pseudouridine synthase [Lachnospiraceae bacterium]
MRLDKYLSDMNLDSRSNLKKAIRKGSVTVDGQMVRDPAMAVPDGAEVTYCGRPVRHETFQYYMLNKPAGVLSATSDRRQKTVLDLLPGERRTDLFPVGRLDKDTTGLLLITNDGDMAHRLLAPKSHVDKVYEALILGRVGSREIEAFRSGLVVDETFTAAPAGLQVLSHPEDPEEEGRDLSLVRITIHEGKFHQIKRMFLAVGMEVLTLKRLSMGSLLLDPDLSEGECRRLTQEELDALENLIMKN